MTPNPTALLVLADGTTLEGFGFGATGTAVGEVCFNTAMTGYEEILTDPSYAGQIITFTFPHIGNVGTNEEDIETVNLAATPGARASFCTPPSPSRQITGRRACLDSRLKARGVIGLAGIDTRALTSFIRKKRHAECHDRARAVRPCSISMRSSMRRRQWPGLVGMDLVPMVTTGQRFTWQETPRLWGEGYGELREAGLHVVATISASSATFSASSQAHGCKSPSCRRKNLRRGTGAQAGRYFLSNGPGDPAETCEYAMPAIRR